MVKKVLREI